MLKEVSACGQISLGKRFAGQLFEVAFHGDGRVEMLPMRAIPVRRSPVGPDVQAPGDWLPPGGYLACNAWALQNRQALDAGSPSTACSGCLTRQTSWRFRTPCWARRLVGSGPTNSCRSSVRSTSCCALAEPGSLAGLCPVAPVTAAQGDGQNASVFQRTRAIGRSTWASHKKPWPTLRLMSTWPWKAPARPGMSTWTA